MTQKHKQIFFPQREQADVDTGQQGDNAQGLPDILRRRFRVYFKPEVKSERRSIRGIRAADIGRLVTFKVGICLNHGVHLERNTLKWAHRVSARE